MTGFLWLATSHISGSRSTNADSIPPTSNLVISLISYPSAERPIARPGQHYSANRIVGCEFSRASDSFAGQLHVHGIENLWTV